MLDMPGQSVFSAVGTPRRNDARTSPLRVAATEVDVSHVLLMRVAP